MTELVPIQTLEIDFIQTFEPEVLHIMETGITRIREIDNTQTIDRETIQTTDQTITTIRKDNKIVLEIETIITQRQGNYSQSPHRNDTQYQNSQQNYRSSTTKHQRQINQDYQPNKLNQTLTILIIQKMQNYS